MSKIQESETRLSPKLLEKIDKASLEHDLELETAFENKCKTIGSLQFNNLYTAINPYINQTAGRNIIIDAQYSRYFKIGFNQDKDICYVGISRFFLELMGLIGVGLAWVNKEQGSGVVYISLVFKRQKNGKLVYANQRLALPVYNHMLKRDVLNAKYVAIIATKDDVGFCDVDAYSMPFEFNKMSTKDGSEMVKQKTASGYKATNF